MTVSLTCTDDGRRSPARSNWLVITGGPCSGKTSVIETLARRGHSVVPEAARAYIDTLLAQGRSLSCIKADISAFERRILMDKVNIESTLPRGDALILDRAVPDSIAYYQFEGLDPAEPLSFCKAVRYRTVLLFEQLAFKKDKVRSENHQQAQVLEHLLEKAYLGLGYNPIRIPPLSVADRTDLVIKHIKSDPPGA